MRNLYEKIVDSSSFNIGSEPGSCLTPPTICRQPMVTEQVSKLGEQIHNIIESLDRLTVKLSPVLSIEPPSDPSGVSKNPLDVPLAQVLSVCVNDLHDIYLRLDTLKSRIEV